MESESLKVNYDTYYSSNLDLPMRWRDIGANYKSKSIKNLVKMVEKNNFPKTVIDFGCGLGNVGNKLLIEDFCEKYIFAEISERAIEFLNMKYSMVDNVEIIKINESFWDKYQSLQIDLTIISHVLEHVENPSHLLSKAIENSNYVIIEVPLEDNIFVNLYLKLKSTILNKKIDRRRNPTVHIQFFNKKSMNQLILNSNGKIIGKYYYYTPLEAHLFNKPLYLKPLIFLKWFFFNIISKIRFIDFVTGHYACLITKRNQLKKNTKSKEGRWREIRGKVKPSNHPPPNGGLSSDST